MDEYIAQLAIAFAEDALRAKNEESVRNAPSAHAAITPDSTETWAIVGFRDYTNWDEFCVTMARLVAKLGRPAHGVSGGAPGVDSMARRWCQEQGIPFHEHLPKYPVAHEYRARNVKIVADAHRVIAFVSPRSRGTKHAAGLAKKAGKPVEIVHVP